MALPAGRKGVLASELTPEGKIRGGGGGGYVLPVAGAETLGGVKVGTGLSITDAGVLNANGYELPTASADTLGGVKVGTGLSIEDGVLSASGGGGSTLYLHKIKIMTGSKNEGYEIINDSATPFTKETFLAHYKSIGSHTMLFHHAEASSSKLTIYVIDCSTNDVYQSVKLLSSDGTATSTGMQDFTDTVTTL